MYNATLHSLDKKTEFRVRNLFQLEYRPIDELRLVGDVAIQKSTGETQVSVLRSIRLLTELQTRN